jgi:DNA-binding GntR family transcriptional regulator
MAQDIRQRIRDGRLPAGELLPSYRLLGEQYQTSYGTVRIALRVLETEGWTVGEPGVGVRVRGDHPE